MAKNSFETVEEIKKQLEAEGRLVRQNKSIDEVTGKPILVVTSKDSFVSAIKNLEPVIEIKGQVANECFNTMRSKSAIGKVGKIAKAGAIIVGIASAVALPAATFIIGSGFIADAIAKNISKNMNKYNIQIVSEDDIIFRLKK